MQQLRPSWLMGKHYVSQLRYAVVCVRVGTAADAVGGAL
jgi:hypothetical protein